MSICKMSYGLSIAALLGLGAVQAHAGSTIDVQINQAKIVKLSRPADTVVVGNPQIADASVQDATTLVLTGKGFGVTNLVVLAEDGTPIVDEQISVSRNSAATVRVYRRAAVQTLHCTPTCESAYQTKAEGSSDADMAASQ